MYKEVNNIPKELNGLLCDYLKSIWEKGWFEEYSKNHYLIKALNGETSSFNNYVNMLEISSGPLVHNIETVRLSFLQALSFSLKLFESNFSEKEAKDFVVEKLSGGKSNYDEDQFLRALSELTVIKWYCLHTRGKNINEVIYEPRLSGKRNPEARFIRDDVIIDVEVKTPGFIPVTNINPKITPTILLNSKGRRELKIQCDASNIELRFPDINKLKQHLNDAAKKFEVPKTSRHFNIVYMNWTYCDYPKYAYIEPYSLLMNENGVFRDKSIGLEIGFNEEVYQKISAIIVYNENIEGYVNQDLRHIWSHRTFALVINPYMEFDKNELERILGMESMKNYNPIPLALYEYYSKGSAKKEDIDLFIKFMNEYNDQIREYAYTLK